MTRIQTMAWIRRRSVRSRPSIARNTNVLKMPSHFDQIMSDGAWPAMDVSVMQVQNAAISRIVPFGLGLLGSLAITQPITVAQHASSAHGRSVPGPQITRWGFM